MSQVSALQSLDLILEDVSAEINLSINALEQYSRVPKNLVAVKKSLNHLNKLKGVFTLLEMTGAQQLVTDSIALVKSLPKKKEESRRKLLDIVSTALARLMRYTEHVNQKPYDLPQLLLPAINSIRDSINAPLLSESVFFECDGNKKRPGQESVFITSEESGEKSRHFRRMYQMGLIEVLRQTNLSGGLKMMQRAMHNLHQECPRPNAVNIWWIAEAMLDGFVDNSLVLTASRLRLFSRLDRQIREVENKPENTLQKSRAETQLVIKEMLYLCVISSSTTNRMADVLAHFELKPALISDAILRQESQEMRGPSEHDYNSIAEALLDEIKSITNALNISRENAFEPINLNQAHKQMINLSNLLMILQVEDQRVRLNVAIELIDKAINNNTNIDEKDSNILFIVMQSISKVVNESELAKYSGNSSTKRSKLNTEQLVICEQTHKLIHQLIQQFELFTKQNRKVLLLKDMHQILDSIRLGFRQLKVNQAISIVEGCLVFIDHHLTNNPHTTTEKAIGLFADIIGSLEFYLETLKYTAQPSTQILEFGQESLLHLNRESNRKQL